jgi:hypothetical protein
MITFPATLTVTITMQRPALETYPITLTYDNLQDWTHVQDMRALVNAAYSIDAIAISDMLTSNA